MAKTLYEKLFDAHVVYEAENETPLLYIDRHLVHEVTSPQASMVCAPTVAGTSAGQNLRHHGSQRLYPD